MLRRTPPSRGTDAFSSAVFPQQNHCGATSFGKVGRFVQAPFLQFDEINRLDSKKPQKIVKLAVISRFCSEAECELLANRGNRWIF
jgi:hypothetical protein